MLFTKELIHAIQLESTFQWHKRNFNADSVKRNRLAWFVMMLRANCVICKEPLKQNDFASA